MFSDRQRGSPARFFCGASLFYNCFFKILVAENQDISTVADIYAFLIGFIETFRDDFDDMEVQAKELTGLTFTFTFFSGWMTPSKMSSPSAETTARVQCATPN